MSLFSLTDDELKAALFLFSPVVDSILNGVDVGVAQRRRPRSSVSKQSSKDSSSVSCSIIYHSMLIFRYFFFSRDVAFPDMFQLSIFPVGY